ncbi:MAG TPA: uracil-DNA glycosylase [Candidatus Baltobacteraceae bacterium]|nr:uracil-DNA glycosylase [Candidatus Baltobacteraceae bacterium]
METLRRDEQALGRPSRRPAASPSALARLERAVVACERCPELRAYCAEVGRVKKRAFRDQEYWARPVPGWGDPDARIVLVGLAPGAHGSNRTGRPFTGDGSGEWLYRALHRAGLANQPQAVGRDDGLVLRDAYITAAVRCAPPQNKPTPAQRDRCAPYLREELEALRAMRVAVTLGKFADDAVHALIKQRGATYVAPRAPFAHLAETRVRFADGRELFVLASYHPSRQNTNTGVLTESMLDAVFARANGLVGPVST